MQTLIITKKKSPTTIPAPVIPFDDDPEYHDDDGDDAFRLLELQQMRLLSVVVIVLVSKLKRIKRRISLNSLGLHSRSLRGPLEVLEAGTAPSQRKYTATTTRPRGQWLINWIAIYFVNESLLDWKVDGNYDLVRRENLYFYYMKI